MTEHLGPDVGELFVEIAPALIVHRLLVLGEPCDEDYLVHLTDDLILPLISRRA